MKEREIGICEICKNEKELDKYEGRMVCEDCYNIMRELEEVD